MADLKLRQVSVKRFQLILSSGATAGVSGIRRLASQPVTAMTIVSAAAHAVPAGLTATTRPAGDCSEQDRDEGPHLDHAVAAGELFGFQVLRQDRILDRAEQRRMDPQQRERDEQQRDAAHQEAGPADQHDRDLE